MATALATVNSEALDSTLKLDASSTLKENFGSMLSHDETNFQAGVVDVPEASGDALIAVRRCRELLRTVPIEDLVTPNEELWHGHAEGEVSSEAKRLQAEADPEGGGPFLSHVWDEPFAWSEHFTAQSFTAAKALQVSTALQEAERRQLHKEGSPVRVWVDFASLPPPVSPSDHPLEQTIFGPYRLPVEELKRFVPRAPPRMATQEAPRYTLMHLPEGHSFTGTMRKTEWDDHGRPLQHPELEEVSWSIPAGWHFIRHCRVIPEGFISPWAAAEKPEYQPLTEQLRRWCARLALREEVWLEFTLGSLRAECLLLADTMLTMHNGLVAVVGWNYFDRLWPLWEWAVFCARRGAQRVQLASDAFSKKAQVEYHRALRRISVVNATCRDSRDRPILLEALEKLFHCKASMEMVGFKTGDSESGPTVLKERMVDFSPVERFVRVTAIAVFAREAALANSRQLEKTDETGWIAMAQELGYDDLWNALKKCKPWDWTDVVQSEDLVQTDLAYEATVEAWWDDYVVPELERERHRALLPP